MIKIGILTFAFTKDNYGQVLQYLATQEYLRQKGYDATLVEPSGWGTSRWNRRKKRIKRLFLFIIHSLGILKAKTTVQLDQPQQTCESVLEKQKNAIFRHWAEVTERKEKEHPRQFEQFREKYFNRQSGTYNEILSSKYKVFCIGSDQTWSCAGYHMMLGWVPKKYKRFTIAPSVGHRQYSDEEIDSFKGYLNKFDFITVRENNGIELCNRCGYTAAKKILDPTFLLKAEDYEPYIEDIECCDKPYVFIYLLGGEIEPSVKDIFDLCKSKGFDIKYVESQGRDEGFECIYATVGQWLGLIKNASYVITNSFHGMAYSIIFHKPYLSIPIAGILERMNERIYDLSKQFQLENRVYSGDLNALFSPIAWNHADQCIRENRETLNSLISNLKL